MAHNLLLMNETFTNGYRPEALNAISLTSILSAIFVIISRNPIVSVLFLIGLFLSIASYLLVLGINFIGLSYLLVYVGAVSILFLFILMLINVRISELSSDTSNAIPLALIIAISFNYPVSQALPHNFALNSYSTNVGNTPSSLAFLFDLFKSKLEQGKVPNDNISGYLGSDHGSTNNKSEIVFVTSKLWDGNLAEATHITSIGNIMYTSYSI